MKLLASETAVLLRRPTASALHRDPPLPPSRKRSTAWLLLRSLGGLLCAAVVTACSEGTGPKALTWTSLTAGFFQTCGLRSTGAAYCWGYNGKGELGGGSASQPHLTPLAVVGGLTFVSVSTDGAEFDEGINNQYHTCGVTTSRVAYCWGSNSYGELGDSLFALRTTPVAVAGGLTFATLTAGYAHTCGVTDGGTAYCWGWNLFGDLGDGSTTDRPTPVAVAGGLRFASLTAGGWHTCGLTSGGAAYCWGDNHAGQLGDSSTTQRLTPVAVAGGLTFASLTAGGSSTCGVTSGGAAYCWGFNAFGQLGDSSTTNRLTPVEVVNP